MMPLAAIRPADPADRAAVEALVREAYSVYIERIGKPPGPMLAAMPSSAANLKSASASSSSTIINNVWESALPETWARSITCPSDCSATEHASVAASSARTRNF